MRCARTCGWWSAGLLAAATATIAAAGRAGTAGRDGRSPDVASACADCHRPHPLFSHPVDVVPSMEVPSELPLHGGRVDCLTCHDAAAVERTHGGAAGAAGADTPLRGPGRGDALLRGGHDGGDLCVRCHDGPSRDASAAHAGGAGLAHLAGAWAEAPDDGWARSVASAAALLDEESVRCLGCHDGLVASDTGHGGAGLFAAPPPLLASGALGVSHPVGVEYGSRRGVELHPRALLDERLRLFDGRIGCGSCHSTYAPGPDLLVVPNTRSMLCLGCHDL